MPLVGLTIPDGPLKLVAFEPRTSPRPVVTANVLVGSAPNGPFRRWSMEVERAVKRWRGLVGRVRTRRVLLSAGAALRLDYDRVAPPRARRLSTVQYVLPAVGRLVSLVYVAAFSEKRAYELLFERPDAGRRPLDSQHFLSRRGTGMVATDT